MKKVSQKSKEIIKLIKAGKRQCEIFRMGYPENTIRYWWRKMNKPKAFKVFILKVQHYNKVRYNRVDKVKK